MSLCFARRGQEKLTGRHGDDENMPNAFDFAAFTRARLQRRGERLELYYYLKVQIK
jgi:hypothetical protein